MKNIILLLSLVFMIACSRTVIKPQEMSANQKFPTVSGNRLSGESVSIPEAFSGKPTVLLIGYTQKTQFDIDRWILGILQAEIAVDIVEIPTIAGMMPQMVQSFIDNGMRSGIPKEDWASVVTVYEDAEKIIQVLGNERPQSTYAVLLNKNGEMIWTSNKGYSASQVLELKKIVEGLN
jgi:hypothetical protein